MDSWYFFINNWLCLCWFYTVSYLWMPSRVLLVNESANILYKQTNTILGVLSLYSSSSIFNFKTSCLIIFIIFYYNIIYTATWNNSCQFFTIGFHLHEIPHKNLRCCNVLVYLGTSICLPTNGLWKHSYYDSHVPMPGHLEMGQWSHCRSSVPVRAIMSPGLEPSKNENI